ncbi:MAG: DUF11 domain-containing protein [Deltaproteobacteria bacterium]|nr:DUF11 domain-containing protein [Deltaproteobacteria bacterium]
MKMGKLFCFIAMAMSFCVNAQGAATLPADLVLTIPLGGDPVEVGQEVHYQFLVDNIGGSSATNVKLGFGLPLEGTLVGISPNTISCPVNQGKVLCDLGVVAPNSPVTVDLFWKAPDVVATLEINGGVTGAGENVSTDADNDAQITTEVVLPPDNPVDNGNGGVVDNGNNADGGDNTGNAAEAGPNGGCALSAASEVPGLPLVGISTALLALFYLRSRKASGNPS